MKRLVNINSFISFMLLAAFGLSSCDQAPSTADPISPDNYPTATFSTDFQGNTVAEGDTIMYHVTTDKPLETPISFELSISGDNLKDSDYKYTPVEFPAFADTTIDIPIIFPNDGIPEKESKDITFTIKDQDEGTKYYLNPDTKYPTVNVTLENHNDPNALTVALGWENGDTDIDMWLNMVDNGSWSSYDGDGDGLILWGSAASSDNPEIMKIPSNDVSANGASGDYYVELDPYDVSGSTINYKFSVGYPDQTVEYYEGTFDTSNLSSYTGDNLDYNYDGSTVWTVYRMLTVNLSSSGSFTVTEVK